MADQNQTEKFQKLLKNFKTVMLTTLTEGEGLHSRPMAIANVDENCDLWFYSQLSSPKVSEIESHEEILATCQDDHDAYLSIYGKATLVQTRDKIKEYWSEPFKVWFPEGVDDPDLVLIHFHTRKGEYWDQSGMSKIKYLAEATKAYATGTTPKVDEDIHATVQL